MDHLQYSDIFLFGLYIKGSSIPIDYENIYKMGIDFIYVYGGATNIMESTLLSAKNNNLRIVFDGIPFAKNYTQEQINTITEYQNSFMGFFCHDEPHLFNTKQTTDNEYYNTLSETDNCIRTVIKIINSSIDISDKFFFTNCLPNYANYKQIFGEESSTTILTSTDYNYYLNLIASTPTTILCGDFYIPGNITDKQRRLWQAYLKSMFSVSKKYQKPLWQFAKCSFKGEKRNIDIQSYRFSIYLNMIFGAESIIWFKYYDEGNYWGSPFQKNGAINNTVYNNLKTLLTGEAKNYGSLFKNSSILDVDFYTKESILPKRFKEIYDGTIIVSHFTKEEHEFMAIFGFSENSSFRIASNYHSIIDTDLSINILPLKVQNIFKLNAGDLIVFFIK